MSINRSSFAEAANEFFDIKYFDEKKYKEPEPISEDFYIHYFNGEKIPKASSSIPKKNESNISFKNIPKIGNLTDVFEANFFIPRTPPKPTNIDIFLNYMSDEQKIKLSEIQKKNQTINSQK